MRIVFLSYDFGEYSIHHASAMAQDHDVRLILAQDLAKPYENCLDPKVDYRPFKKHRLRQPFRQALSIRRLLRQIDEFQPDVVHVQRGHMWFNWVMPLLAKKYPVVLTIHDPRHHLGDKESQKTPQWLMDRGHRAAHRVIVHGESLRQPCVDQIGLCADHIHVVPHIAIGEARRVNNLPEREGQVLCFGRVYEYKGLDYFAKAEPLVRAEVEHGGFVIAGRGEYTDYRQHIQDPSKFTILNEWIEDERRAELFQQSSIVVLPYVEATQSGVIPVAYQFAKPVVATKVGALADAVDDGVTGMLVPPRDEQALADAIIKLLRDKSLRHQMGLAGKQKLDTEQSPPVVAAETVKIYDRAIADVGQTRAHIAASGAAG
jgi:glycosyltransferase involved in cell wall biosynthesis